MKKILLFFIIFYTSGCYLEPVKVNMPVKKWYPETDYFFTEEIYNHPQIVKNIRFVLNDLTQIINIDFYELAESNDDCIIFDYGKENQSKNNINIIKITSEELTVAYYEVFKILGHENKNIIIKPTENDYNKLKEIYGSR